MKASPSHLAWCLAICACACADTQAQSNVTVYGLVDMNVGWTSNLARDGSNLLRVNSGGMNTSRLGFLGSEDLGGGTKALFQLEMGIAADTGVADNPLFKRQATVGLAGRWGTVLVGRAFTTVYDFVLPYDPMGYAPMYSWAPTGNASGASKYGMALAFDNMIKYTGKVGNFGFGASYGAGEQASLGDGAKGAVAASYAAGPVSMVATYERINGTPAAGAGAHDVTTAWHLGAMVDTGRLKLQAAMRDYKLAPAAAGPDVRARLVWGGANYLVTPVLTATGAVYYQDVKNVPRGTDADPVMVVGRLRYALSKRTDLYLTGAYARARHGQLVSLARDEAGFGTTQRSVLAGIQHRF
jgi:predicted porin